jgi:hypothetical protein
MWPEQIGFRLDETGLVARGIDLGDQLVFFDGIVVIDVELNDLAGDLGADVNRGDRAERTAAGNGL